MKNIIIIACCIIFNFTNSYSQYFEGIIEYTISYNQIHPGLDLKEFKENMGEKTITYIKDGFFIDQSDANFMRYLLYRNCDSAIYFYNKILDDTLYVQQTSVPQMEDLNFSLIQNADTILGHICDKIFIEDQYGSKSYYFNPDLALNPEDYRNYTLDNKYELVKIMKSVYLRLEILSPYFRANIVATRIERKKLKDRIFKIPKGKYIKSIN